MELLVDQLLITAEPSAGITGALIATTEGSDRWRFGLLPGLEQERDRDGHEVETDQSEAHGELAGDLGTGRHDSAHDRQGQLQALELVPFNGFDQLHVVRTTSCGSIGYGVGLFPTNSGDELRTKAEGMKLVLKLHVEVATLKRETGSK